MVKDIIRLYEIQISVLIKSIKLYAISETKTKCSGTVLFYLYENKTVLKSLFADELFIRYRDPTVGEKFLQWTANQIHLWSLTSRLNFSYAKFTLIHFCKHYSCLKTMEIKIDNFRSIPSSETAKYLGLTFDSKLSCKLHVQDIRRRCFLKMNILKKLAYTKFGSSCLTLLKIYRTLIRPTTDYGSAIYNFTSPTHLNSLNIIHNTCLRLATGAFRTPSTPSLLCEAGELPLDIRGQYISAATIVTMLANPIFRPPVNLLTPTKTPSPELYHLL